MRAVRTLTPAEVRNALVGRAGLRRVVHPAGRAGARAVLKTRRHIQLDPLDPMGTNADLTALARVDGLRRGEIYRANLPGHAFEHFAKERCLLPAHAFPRYRDRAVAAPWWRLGDRLKRLDAALLEEVLAEVRERGPVSAAEMADRGRVQPLDWSGWKGTGRATTLALEVLWTRCQVVVHDRGPSGKRYAVPEQSLGRWATARVKGDFYRWALRERVEAAGLLALAGGSHWSSLHPARTSDLPRQLVEEGELQVVRIAGSRRPYLAPADFGDRDHPPDDGRMRLLGPLDPLLWDRRLVRDAFGFDYVWEVYKPAARRRWGWYVCPLLHRGELVGRLEGRVHDGRLRIHRLWQEEDRTLDPDALHRCLARHAQALQVELATPIPAPR